MNVVVRQWDQVREKCQAEGVCRNFRECGHRGVIGLEAAHISGRTHDAKPPIGWDAERHGEWGHRLPLLVHPDRIIPLCGPATDSGTCHNRFDSHELSILALLRPEEQLQAVADLDGIENARIRLDPLDYREPMQAARRAPAQGLTLLTFATAHARMLEDYDPPGQRFIGYIAIERHLDEGVLELRFHPDERAAA